MGDNLTVEIENIEMEAFEIRPGGDASNPTWEEYLEGYDAKYHTHINLIKEKIKDIGWVGKCANEVCNETAFVFSDGTRIGYTWRAWGDLMQAIVGKREGYMAYYC